MHCTEGLKARGEVQLPKARVFKRVPQPWSGRGGARVLDHQLTASIMMTVVTANSVDTSKDFQGPGPGPLPTTGAL